ncbi:ATPase [Novosphingobium sp.]|uniref:ATPase n=1 Tax=Novosphingobium sp. TaxID=1874826 RepID=UPI002B4997BA|nr:ATPase [Novosphingobium sp.]HKR92660.1 ATPase [Novosphingobium sp.]
MRQIALPLSAAREDPPRIVVGNANGAVLDALMEPDKWPFRTAILFGPPRSGKSLMARWFVESGRGDALDNAPDMDEAELFHCWNRAQENCRPLLILTDRRRGAGEGRWHVGLPDLASRLGAALELEIGEPDDEMLIALMEVHAEMRSLILDHSATQYLVGRCERSHLGVERLVAAIDRLSLERKQAPTMAIWRDALIETKRGGWGED